MAGVRTNNQVYVFCKMAILMFPLVTFFSNSVRGKSINDVTVIERGQEFVFDTT
jgi:hypothetical protein